MDFYGRSVDIHVDMDMDRKFHIHGKPEIFPAQSRTLYAYFFRLHNDNTPTVFCSSVRMQKMATYI